MRQIHRSVAFTIAMVIAALVLIAMPAQVEAHGGGHFHGGHHHWHHRPHWGIGVGVGIGFGTLYDEPRYPDTVLVAPAPLVLDDSPPIARAPAAPDPVISPRKGQDAAQTEADRQACNRWATTQANAMVDAGVFHRSTLACMEERGYSVR